MTKQSAYWYWLSTCNASFASAKRLIEYYGSTEELFTQIKHRLPPKGFASPSVISSLIKRADEKLINSELSLLFKTGLHLLTLADADYPDLLAHIASPPLMLYMKGDIRRLNKNRLAIVGMRDPSRTAFANTKNIARELSAGGVSIVSGLARGIDTAALSGAIEGGSPCAAVLGCGADVVYPTENRQLYEAIAERGAILSEFPPGTRPLPGNFPKRNRLMSGMCPGVLIAQARAQSGTSLTLRCAVEENREVFALPTNINEDGSELPNLLITEGAIPVISAENIFLHFGWHSEKTVNFEKKAPVKLDFCEQQLYTLLKQGDLSTDELARQTGLSPDKLVTALTTMEIKGVIERRPGNMFGLKILT